MSTETQIAALVTASNNLTSAVTGKIAAIDQKVAVAVSSIPGEIVRLMSLTVYVDAISGNDANTGVSFAQAKASIKAAVQACPSGSSVSIILKSGSVYSLTGADIFTGNKTVTISPDNYVFQDRSTYVEIRSEPQIAQDGSVSCSGFLLGVKGFIYLIGCRITTGKLGTAHVGKEQNIWLTAFFKTNSGYATVFMQHCQVDIWHGAMTYQHSNGSIGKTDLIMRNVLLSKQDISVLPVKTGYQYMMGSYGNAPIPFSMYGIEMSRLNIPTWASTIVQDLTNAITNLRD